MRTVIGRPPATSRLPVRVVVLAAALHPLPTGMRLQVQRPEFVETEISCGSSGSGTTSPSAIAYMCSARAFFVA